MGLFPRSSEECMNDMMSSLSLSCGWRGSAGTGSFVQQVKNYLLPFSRAACRQCADEYLPPSRGGTRVPETAAHPRRLPALHFVPGWCVSAKPFAGVLPVCPRKVRLRLLQSLLWAVWPEVSDDPSRVSGQAFFKPCCSCLSVWTLIFSTTDRKSVV